MAEYIEREAALEVIRAKVEDYDVRQGDALEGLYVADCEVAALPTADVAPVRHGRWDGEGDGYAEADDGEMTLVYDVWHCSECGHIVDEGIDDPELLPNFCPNCGAKMDGGVE